MRCLGAASKLFLTAALLAVSLALLAPAGTALGQAGKPSDSLACRRQCQATSPDRAMNPPAVQACLLRCTAGESHLSRQHQRGTAEATGRGTTAAPTPPLAAGVPSNWPPRGAPAAVTPPLSAGVPSIMPQRAASGAGRSLVAYASPPPGRSLAISMPVERMAAHRGAETECFRRNNNNPCRLLFETQDRCLAVAHGVRANGLVITADPRTYTVHHYGTGSGGDETSAEFAALRDCSGRLAPGVSCRIAASRCG